MLICYVLKFLHRLTSSDRSNSTRAPCWRSLSSPSIPRSCRRCWTDFERSTKVTLSSPLRYVHEVRFKNMVDLGRKSVRVSTFVEKRHWAIWSHTWLFHKVFERNKSLFLSSFVCLLSFTSHLPLLSISHFKAHQIYFLWRAKPPISHDLLTR